MLLSIHGGPFTQYGTGFFDEFQVYAGAGYAVVYSNPRGPSGSSEDWGRAIRGLGDGLGPGWGLVDYDDPMAVMDTALERYDFCDPERTGVLGGSYGGFMTSWIVSHSNRFKAACSNGLVNNMVSMYGSSDIGWVFKGYHARSSTTTWSSTSRCRPGRTRRRSRRRSDPPLGAGSALQHRAGRALHDAAPARARSRARALPGREPRALALGRPVHRVRRFEILLDWFDRYLK